MVGHGRIVWLELTLLNIPTTTRFMHMSYCIAVTLFTLNDICICFLTHACMNYKYVWILLKCVDWFNHHFWFLANLLSSLWCIFACVFPSKPPTIIGFQGAHSPNFLCVRTVHAPFLTHRSCHTLSINKDILLAFMWNRVKALPYDPLLGLLHQIVWGLIGTSYRGDTWTCWRVQHCQHL